jgi:hypothetical protein
LDSVVFVVRNSSNIYQKNNKYHTVGTAPISTRKTTNTTLSEQLQYLTEKQQIPHSQNSSCSDSEVFVLFLLDIGAVPTVRYLGFFCSILELLRHCGICCFSVRYWSCSDSEVFVTNTTLSEQLQYLTEKQQIPHCWNSSNIYQKNNEYHTVYWSCSDSVVFVVFLLDIGAVPTVVFVVFLLDIGAVPTVRYVLFFC